MVFRFRRIAEIVVGPPLVLWFLVFPRAGSIVSKAASKVASRKSLPRYSKSITTTTFRNLARLSNHVDMWHLG